MSPPPEPPQKENRQVLLELFHESIGLESGLGRTAQALWREPIVVLKAYLANEKTYISPFKILWTGLGLWIVINSFIIDWYAIWAHMASDYINWMMGETLSADDARLEKVQAIKAGYISFISRFGGDLFSKIYVPMVVIVIPLSAMFVQKSCAKLGADFRSLVAANSYVMGTNIFAYLLCTTLVAINAYAFLGFAVVAMVLIFFGINIFILIPPRRFFGENGKAIEKKMIKGNMLSIFAVMGVLAVGYGVWFVWVR